MDSADRLLFEPPELGCVLSLTGLPGDGSKIYDRSPYGNIGAITGASWKRLPSGLWCLSFDGNDDKVECGDDDSLVFGDGANDSAFSIMAWVKMIDATNFALLSKGVAAKYEYIVILDGTDKLLMRCYSGGDATKKIGRLYDTPLTTYEGKWVHIAGIYDSSKASSGIKLFLNASQVDDADASGGTYVAMDNYGEPVRIGRVWDSTTSNGFIALPRIYNRALTTLEIQNHFLREKDLFGVW